MFLSILLIILGFILLIKGANLLVNGSSKIAKRLNISEFIIGLTIVSIGTSMPELLLSITSTLKGYSDVAIGNVIGSNISNILMILGISAFISPIYLKKETKIMELPMSFAVAIIFIVLCNIDKSVSRIDAIILLALFVMFMWFTIIISSKEKRINKNKNNFEQGDKTIVKDFLLVIIGIILLKLGGDLTVDNAYKLATFFNLSEKIMSIVILSIGTSLPELVTSIAGAIKGKSDIVIGNVLGSNMFNLLLITGTAALIRPIIYNVSYNIEMLILILATFGLAILPIIPPKNKISRENGFIYCVIYFSYMFSLFIK